MSPSCAFILKALESELIEGAKADVLKISSSIKSNFTWGGTDIADDYRREILRTTTHYPSLNRRECVYCGQYGEPMSECKYCGAPIGGPK